MSDRPAWDGTHLEFQDDDIVFDNIYEPWKKVTKTTRTITITIKGIQQTLYKEKAKLLLQMTSLKHLQTGTF